MSRDGQEIVLNRVEFGLLELLLRNAEQVLSYEVIQERVWGYGEAPASNALAVFVGFLRRKLEDGGRQRLVHNVRGGGYVIGTDPCPGRSGVRLCCGPASPLPWRAPSPRSRWRSPRWPSWWSAPTCRISCGRRWRGRERPSNGRA